ncbi:YdcF family protein [Streptosporangiaceae bacterium NEAU-GS5]|nr:YdcF family protein [Streptosporangiaceae bacterium NEAU-GS5]
MTNVALTAADFELLAQIMASPHGEAVSPDRPVDLLIVFSCADAEVGRMAARLHREGLINRVVFSGGIGKDSGGLPALGISEAKFLASIAIADGLSPELITLEEEARNGAENAALSLQLVARQGILGPRTRVASLAPAQRSRRLFEELRFQAHTGSYPVDVTHGFASGQIDPTSSTMRQELVNELRGLHTMHAAAVPRILLQAEFQPGGKYFDLVQRAGVA